MKTETELTRGSLEVQLLSLYCGKSSSSSDAPEIQKLQLRARQQSQANKDSTCGQVPSNHAHSVFTPLDSESQALSPPPILDTKILRGQ